MKEGYVYILTNLYVPDLVKIGYTDRHPDTRANELSNTTGVPGKWVVHDFWLLENAYLYEQRIFSELAPVRVTGEFFRLSAQVAVDKISALLFSWSAIDASGLSAVAKKEAEKVQKERAHKQAERDKEILAWQKKQERIKAIDSLANFFQEVSRKIEESETRASNDAYKKWTPWFRQNCIKNASIWGFGAFFFGLAFFPKVEGAMLLGAIFGLFAYGLGDNAHSDDFQLPLSKAKLDARNSVLIAHQLQCLIDRSLIISIYHDHRGFTVESVNDWESFGSMYEPKFKNKQSGEEISGKSVIHIERIGYFDKSEGRLLI